MPSIINATTTNGVAISPDNSGSLQLATNNGTTAVTIDTSQNVLVGTTSSSYYKPNFVVNSASSTGLSIIDTSATLGMIAFGSGTNAAIGGSSNRGKFWYDLAGDSFNWNTAGTGSLTPNMRIDSSGNVGIGTSSPSRRLMVEKSAGAVGFGSPYVQVGAANYANGGYYTIGFGYVGGSYTTAPAEIGAIATDDSGGGKVALTFATRDVTTNTAPTERMRITSGGVLCVGTTATTGVGETAVISGNNNVFVVRCNDSQNTIVTSNSSGTATYKAGVFCNNGSTYTERGNISVGASSVTYNTTSDYRLKENITPMTGALAKVQFLKPCTYTWKETGKAGQGFIAHELAEVVPDCVTGEKDAVDAEGKPVYQGVDTSFLVATLTAAIQEQQAMIETLKTELDTVKAELNTLKNPPVEGTE